MVEMAKHRRGSRKQKKQKGGGLGAGYGFTGASRFDTTVNNPVVASSITSCRAPEPMTLRPGFMPGGVTARGLPGMGGGGRKRKHSMKKQKGGRYGFDPSAASAIGGTPWGSSYAPVSAIPCEASRSAIPLSGASGSLNVHQANTSGPQSGGAAPLTYDMRAGVPSDFTPDRSPGSGAPGEIALRAAYSDNLVPGIDTAGGGKLMIHTPMNASQMNPACLKTGGGRVKHSRKVKKSRKAKKSRKMKGRKH